MILSQSDKQIIVDWLQNKCGVMRCTCCGHNVLQLIDIATLPIGFDIRTTRFFYAQGCPQVTVMCQNCGHLIFFNPAIMGLKPIEPQPETTPIHESPPKESE